MNNDFYSANSENDMYIDYEAARDSIESVLDELVAMRTDPVFMTAVGANTVEKLKTGVGIVKKRLSDAFNLVIIGDFKRGKSTLVNALTGAELAPVSAIPETSSINRFSYGDTESYEAVFTNHKRVKLDKTKINRKELTQIQQDYSAQIESLDIKYPCELLKSINIIDTPGLGDFPNKLDEMVCEYLVKADAVVYVTSILAPLSASELAFINSVVIPQNFKKLFVVLNMADVIGDEEQELDSIKSARDKLAALNNELEIYTLSALDELCRQLGRPAPKPERSDVYAAAFDKFRGAVEVEVADNREIIKSMRGLTLTKKLLASAYSEIDAVIKVLNGGAGKIEENEKRLLDSENETKKKLDELKSRLLSCIIDMKSEAAVWIDEYLNRIKDDLRKYTESKSSQNIERYLQTYLIDKIREGCECCIDAHTAKIGEILKNEGGFITEMSGMNIDSMGMNAADRIDTNIWTGADSITFTAEFIMTTVGLDFQELFVLGQTVAGFFRLASLKKKKAELINPLLNDFESVNLSVKEKLSENYDETGRKICSSLDELYGKRLERIRETNANAVKLLEKENGDTAQTIGKLQIFADRLKNLSQQLG